MLRQNMETGRIKKDASIAKGCIIGFRKVNKKMVTISIVSAGCLYYWENDTNSDNEKIVYIPFSESTCETVADVISRAAGFQGVKIVKDTEQWILLKVI